MKKIYLAFSFLILLLIFNNLYAQTEIFANLVTFESNVDNSQNAVVQNDEFATLNSNGGVALGIGNYTGELELQFPNTIPANTTTFVKIEFDEDILNTLLGGSLGTLLADVAGAIVLGNHFFNIEARLNSTSVFEATSQVAPTNNRFRIVKDADGNFYIAITPDEAYNRIYIEDETNTLLLGVDNSMRVFNAFYYEENDSDCAYNPLYTDFDGSGLNVDALSLGGAGVTNPEFAIDADPTNFSQLSLGIVSVTSSITQNVYFPDTYSPEDQFAVTIKTEPTLVTLGLLNQIEIKAFNDSEEVFTTTIASTIGLDVLTLLQNGEQATIEFTPGIEFNRVSITLNNLLGVNLAQSLDFFGAVALGPQAPTTLQGVQDFCAIDEPTIADLQVNETTNIIWYDSLFGGNQLAATTMLENDTFYFAAQEIDGCIGTRRLSIEVNLDDPEQPTTNETNQSFCFEDSPTIENLSVNENPVTWYDTETGGTPLSVDTTLIDGNSYYAVQVIDGCEGTQRLEVSVTVQQLDAPTAMNTNQFFCQANNPNLSDIQTNESVIWYSANEGGEPLDENTALQNGTYYAAQQSNIGCESNERLAINVEINDSDVPTTNSTNQIFCDSENPLVANLQVNEDNVTWYDMAIGGTAYSNNESLVDGQTYYAGTTTNGCESSQRLAVTVTVESINSPTTNNTTQNFCQLDNPTVADIMVNEENVIWYETADSDIPLDQNELLEDSESYFGAISNSNDCESTQRLEVQIVIEDTVPPTSNDVTQDFCKADDPTVENLSVQGENIMWYSSVDSDMPISLEEPLVNGQSYFASQTPENACESSDRTEIVAVIQDINPPSANNTTQQFCSSNNPKVEDLMTNSSNVVWYNSENGSTPYESTDSLIDGEIYYGANVDPNTNCESSERLEVSVIVTTATNATITSDGNGFACTNNTIRYTTESGNEEYTWTIENGTIINGGQATDNFVDVQWAAQGTYDVSVSYSPIESCSTGEMTAITVNVQDCGSISISKTSDDMTPQIGEEITFNISISNSGPNNFSNVIVQEQIQSGFEIINVNSTTGFYNANEGIWTIPELPVGVQELNITVEVLETGEYYNVASLTSSSPPLNNDNISSLIEIQVLDVIINNQYSPNNDGVNDVFKIDNIQNHPNNTLRVYNRYGSIIYEKKGYDNSWDGTASVGGLIKRGERLPSETYYYVLELPAINKTLTGWLFIAY